MRIRKLGWRLFLTCFIIISITLWVTTWYSARVFNRIYLQTTIRDVSTTAYLLQRDMSLIFTSPINAHAIDSVSKKIGHDIAMRITVVLPSGKVIGDSQSDPDTMENHANRPEILKAITGSTGIQQRLSSTLHQDMLYYAIPLRNGDSIKAVLRIAVSLKDIHEHERSFYLSVAFASLIIFIILIIVSFLLSQRMSIPIRHIKNGAQRFASGELDFKLSIPEDDDLGGLAVSLNKMAASLDERIKTIIRQKNELNAILISMNEGVIAVDNQQRVISMNPAAIRLFGVTDSTVNGKWLHEIIRNSTLQRFITHVLSSDTLIETAFILHTSEGDLNINASGTILSDGPNGPEGAVLVFNDITRLKRLENLRKDFVSNVSHELRTPLTSIKGFIETIQSGDYNLSDEVNEFLGIISTKTDHLCSIVEDILSLSSIERDHDHREIIFTETNIVQVLDDAIKTCSAKANKKKITLNLSSELQLRFMMNALLLEQAVVNLIDNAIKYSDNGKKILIAAVRDNKDVVISVTDQGIGIPKEHLERVFERFYRVDKARSRKLGGTGLGLSIVKNIVIAHGGRVVVESEPGIGSTFKIILPANLEN